MDKEVKKKKIYLLYNPKSGKETVKASLSDIIERFSAAGFEITVRPTSYSGEATKITANIADKYDILVCCGGDGTLNEVVTGNLVRKMPLNIGYIPCGSTNDFGRTIYGDIGILQAVDQIVGKHQNQIDCGKLEDRTFIYAAAFGLFTDISYETPHSEKAALGHAAYMIEAAKNIGNMKPQSLRAVIDGERVIEGEFLIGMVTNAESIGGFQNIPGRNVSLQDGKMELTMISCPEKLSDYGKVLQALLDGGKNEFVIRRKIKEVQFFFDEETAFTVDGEYGGAYKKANVICVPSAVTLYY